MKEEVFISYAWNKKAKGKKLQDPIITAIQKALENDFKVVIDKEEVDYKDNIQEFEERLGRGQKVVLVVSDKFLKSSHCMFEVLKIKERGNVYERIFPVVLEDATIYNSNEAAKYIKHWESEIKKLNNTLSSLNSKANTETIQFDLNNFTSFRAIIDDFRGLLSKMNTLSPETHLGTNFKALVSALNGDRPTADNKSEKVYASKIKATKKLFEKAIQIIEGEVKGESKNAFDILEKIKHFYQQCKDQNFQIAVLAMVKSGKSTFLNSLLGNEFLPMNNVPETAVPIRIVHSENETGVLNFNKSKIEGAHKIKAHLEEVNKVNRSNNGTEEEVEFNLHASFIVLKEKEMTDIKFEILDSAGFGEALPQLTAGKSINQSTSDLVDQISAIIYLLDYTKLKTKDEEATLDKIIQMRPDILDKIQDRLFFIINQIDEEDRNSLTKEEAIDFVYNAIKDKMPDTLRQNIFTVSAKQALLSRLILTGNDTPAVKSDFAKIAFGIATAGKKTDIEYNEAAREILTHSNIEEIEFSIINHIFENRSKIFFESLQDNLKRLLQEFKNKYVTTASGTLSKTVQEIEALEEKIKEAKKKQQSIQEEADKFEAEIRNWMEAEFKGFEKSTIDHIESAFNIGKAEEKQSFLNKIIPNWVKKLQHHIKNAEEQSTDSSYEEIEAIVKELNQIISSELHTSFIAFKKSLENKVLSKQNTLFESLKQTINSLAREFETTLKKELKIELEAVELHLDAINLDKMLSDADVFLDRFVKSNYRIQNVKRSEQVLIPGSWCGQDRLQTRYVMKQEWIQENNINKNVIELHWRREIETYNSNAVFLTNRLIESGIKTQIKHARKSFDSYVDDYMTTIREQKAKLSSNSTEEIGQRLVVLEELDKSISLIITDIG
jgi:GTPase SAR1 family protein